MIQKLFNSGQVITLATGQTYTLKSDEVMINTTIYKKTDLEIAFHGNFATATPTNVKVGIKKRDGVRDFPADYVTFGNWEIDTVAQTTLALCVVNINSAIFTNVGGNLLYSVYAGIIKGNYLSTTSGSLVIGKTYNVISTLSTDDFANVGWVSDGTDFVATGTTPTVWTNSSEVVNVTDSAPTIIELENSTGETVTPSYNATTLLDTISITGNAFAVDKTAVMSYKLEGGDITFIILDTSTITAGDGASGDHYFEIRIYP